MVRCGKDMVQIWGALPTYKKKVEAVNRRVNKEVAFQNLAIFNKIASCNFEVISHDRSEIGTSNIT